MSQQIDREGTFRGNIVAATLREADSGAQAVSLTVAITEMWVPEESTWEDWRQYDVEASGDIWVIKKDTTVNEAQVRALVDHAGWDGRFASVLDGTWKPRPVQVVVQEDTYKDRTRYRVAWVNAHDGTPGGGNVSPEKAKALEAKYGAQMRALAGNSVRAAQKPATAAPPKPKQPTPTPQPMATGDGTDTGGDGIPF